ncbi:hypothetical protein SDC9_55737 [bioreactor metagenome]|uniref:Uncharacterized protein n=1 Tax=bioreactor metagenome TaxID=1076179 RepID=A0A644WZT5_9ZZZZ
MINETADSEVVVAHDRLAFVKDIANVKRQLCLFISPSKLSEICGRHAQPHCTFDAALLRHGVRKILGNFKGVVRIGTAEFRNHSHFPLADTD